MVELCQIPNGVDVSNPFFVPLTTPITGQYAPIKHGIDTFFEKAAKSAEVLPFFDPKKLTIAMSYTEKFIPYINTFVIVEITTAMIIRAERLKIVLMGAR